MSDYMPTTAEVQSGYAHNEYRYRAGESEDMWRRRFCRWLAEIEQAAYLRGRADEFDLHASAPEPLEAAQVRRVRELHKRVVTRNGIHYCEHCESLCHSYSGIQCDGQDGEWPCATIQALDGG